jgi:hypothetical protein
MRRTSLLLLYAGLAVLGTSLGCGDIVPVWSGEATLKGQTLHFTEGPLEFPVDIEVKDSIVNLRLELQVTYYQGIGRDNLPLFLILEDKDHNIIENTTDIQLKAENEWLGIQEKNEIDYTITHNAIPDISLAPGKYSLKIYANDEKAEKIYGVVRIVARFYRYEDGLADEEEGDEDL